MVQPVQDSLVKLWWREVAPLAQERAAKQYSGVRFSWSFLQSSYPVPSGRYRDPSAATPDRRLRRYGFGGKAELFQPELGRIPWRAAPKPTLELRTTPLSLSPPPLERPCAWPGSPTHWLLRSALSSFGDN